LKPDAVTTPNITDGQQSWVWTGQDFSAWSGPSRKTDPAAHNDGLSRSCFKAKADERIIANKQKIDAAAKKVVPINQPSA
jgi:hypothetical protein